MLRLTLLTAVICCYLGVVLSAPLGSGSSMQHITKKRLTLLQGYGYLQNNDASALDLPTLREGLRRLQKFAGLNVTGELDSATLEKLEAKRCGMNEIGPSKAIASSSAGSLTIGRYYLQGTSWDKAMKGQSLTYKVISYTRDLHRQQQRQIFKKAFNMWQAASKLTITDVTHRYPPVPDDQVDILISFVRRYHSDAYPFDGQGGKLAHAFYPHNNKGRSGDAHFDDDEPFTTGTKDGINLDWVAVHEFGHSLGLEHSSVRKSIMYPWYKGYKEDIELTYDDIQGIQALYGKPRRGKPPVKPVRPTQPPRPTQPRPHECKVQSYDTFFMGADEKTYAVAGPYYWNIAHPNAGNENGRHNLATTFPGIRTPVDAAFSKNGKTLFFKGSKYWQYRYDNRLLIFVAEKTGRPISECGLTSALNDMDAAFVYRNNKIYFFKGDQYWKYTESGSPQKPYRVYSRYPRTISRGWRGLKGPVDCAMTWASNNATYFFTGTNYKKIEKVRHQVQSGYPKKIATNWMKCRDVGALVGALNAGEP